MDWREAMAHYHSLRGWWQLIVAGMKFAIIFSGIATVKLYMLQ